MKVLWICGLPAEVRREVLAGENYGADASWSWIMAHLPPPPGVDLHIACRVAHGCQRKEFVYRGATFHLVPVAARARVFCLYQFDGRYYRELFAQLRPDMIHGWGTEDAYACVALGLAPRRHIIGVQGLLQLCRARASMPWKTWFGVRSEKLALAGALQVVAENEFSRSAVAPLVKRGSIQVVEHPLREVFYGTPSDGTARTVLFLGAIESRKGIWDAVEAFRRGAPKDWRLVVIGNGSPANESRLSDVLASPELNGRAEYKSSATEMEIATQMQLASVLLLPTWVDTGPTTLKESLAMGLWPICYDNTGPGHYLRKFSVGRLVEDRDVEALVGALREELSECRWENPVFRDQVRQVIRPSFERDRIWPELMRVYQEVVANERLS